jgi:hypothetical protein
MALRHVQRGLDDAKKDRAPLFQRKARDGKIVATVDDDMADNWDVSAREDYLLGYHSAEVSDSDNETPWGESHSAF